MGKRIYLAPIIKVVEFSVEKGFAGSGEQLATSWIVETQNATWVQDGDFEGTITITH